MTNPTGFVAVCRCGNIVAALDYRRMDHSEVGKAIGDWLIRGLTVEPQFGSAWSVNVKGCECGENSHE